MPCDACCIITRWQNGSEQATLLTAHDVVAGRGAEEHVTFRTEREATTTVAARIERIAGANQRSGKITAAS